MGEFVIHRRREWTIGSIQAIIWLLFYAFVQVPPVSAQGPSVGNRIAFLKTEFELNREGYFSLEWNRVDAASEYVVTLVDNQNAISGDSTPRSMNPVFYRGEFQKAFISGLENGTYTYQVRAMDNSGRVLAESSVPAVVVVSHWPLWQALSLFGIGLLVFLVLMGIIVRGAFSVDRLETRAGEEYNRD